MSCPREYYIFDAGCPEIVVTSATPRRGDFGKVEVPRRRANSQDPGFLRVPRTELGEKRAKDSRASQRSRLLQRSPSMPVLAQVIRQDSMEKGAKFASKAPWALEGKGPQRLDLSLWRSRKSRLSTKTLTIDSVSTEEVNKCASTPGTFTVSSVSLQWKVLIIVPIQRESHITGFLYPTFQRFS